MPMQYLFSHEGTNKWFHRATQVDTVDKVKRGGGLFPDKSEMMITVQASMCKPEYKVTDFYAKTGWAQKIARTNMFDNVTLAVIGMNSLWIAIDMDKYATMEAINAEIIR